MKQHIGDKIYTHNMQNYETSTKVDEWVLYCIIEVSIEHSTILAYTDLK